MKKVTILSLHLNYGGIEKCICTLANMLCEDYEVEIVSSYKLTPNPVFYIDPKVKITFLEDKYFPRKEEWKESIKRLNIKNIFIETKNNLIALFLKKYNMIKYLKGLNTDVIISTRDIFNKMSSKYGTKDALKIGWEHNYPHQNTIKKVVSSIKKLDYFVLLTNSASRMYKKYTNIDYKVIPNSIDLVKKSSKLDQKNLIAVGRLSKEKGFDDLIKVFYYLNKKEKGFTLDIIGDGEEYNSLLSLIKEYKLENKVKLYGFKNQEFIGEKLSKSMIYLMTSHTESFSLTVVEAMNYGVPAIAFDDAEGPREIIKDELNGYIIKNRNINSMVEKIIYISKEEAKRKELSKCAKESIKKYSFDSIKQMWISLIEGDK